MIPALAYPIAIGAALPTTLVVLALWVVRSRLVDHDSVDSVLLPMIFLLVPLIFFVSHQPDLSSGLAAGGLAALACVWTQRGTFGRRSTPVSASAVVLLAVADMLILAGGLSLLPGDPIL